ncbi:MAG TPA: LysR substrate-binding domain-containing protein [Burkholderiales bacterium]|nr:LysR substrate-binding domain-containing protein [Burkholderiales bacterium]
MTLTELRYIVAVARERHFGRAAQACFVSQPTLSVAVKKLEEELGLALFERTKTDVGVTPVGARIVEQAQRVLDELEGIKRIAREARDPLDGPLRLGAIYTVGPYLFPLLVPVLHASAPRMPLIIEENYTGRLRERLVQGELDAALLCLPFEEPGVVTLPLYDEPFVVMVPAGHPWAQREAVATDQLSTQTVLLLGAGHCFRDQVVAACPSCVGPPAIEGGLQKAVEGSSLETIRHMVASGLGITVLPCTAAAGAGDAPATLTAIRPFSEPPRRRVALAWRASYPRPQAIEALRRAIRACPLGCVTYLAGPSA